MEHETSHDDDALVAPRTLHPWQCLTLGSGLMLHAPLAMAVEFGRLQSDIATLDSAICPDGRTFLASDGSWSAIPLIERLPPLSAGPLRSGRGTPALAYAPAVRHLLSLIDWTVLACYVTRLEPGGTLAWHFDSQAIHLRECRLLVPIHVPPAARTMIGYEAVAYPTGTAWMGDFSFPHQVENPTSAARIVLAVDLLSGPEVRRLLPPARAEAAAARVDLAGAARNLLLRWRARGPGGRIPAIAPVALNPAKC
jgi:hypothetical protein